MAKTVSSMPELGRALSSFSLPDTRSNKQIVSTADYANKPLLLMFICNHCPYVIFIAQRLAEVANEMQQKGFAVVAINANDIEHYPQDAPDKMNEFAQEYGFDFPYCFDESQQVAIDYGAACTPDFFVYDAQHKLQYRGQFDDARPGNQVEVTGSDLQTAMQAVLLGQTVTLDQKPSLGCNIKWRNGNAPDYD